MAKANPETAVELLEEIRRLMELKGENPFKVRAFDKAIDVVSGRQDLAERARQGTLTELPGIGKGIAEVLTEFFTQGASRVRDELRDSLPPGLLELTEIPGLGPKKAMQLIEELGIASVAELEYACKENRLLRIKGFGEKLQHKILEGIAFRKANQGMARLVDALPVAESCLAALRAGGLRVEETGALRRRGEVLSSLDFLVELADGADREALVRKVHGKGGAVPVNLHFASPKEFAREWLRTSATEQHLEALPQPLSRTLQALPTEEAIYAGAGLAFIPPEARETGEEVRLAKAAAGLKLLPWDGVRGVFHNHTTRSDGRASLEEMVLAAKALGYSYIGISDHSQSAFYAQGLTPAALLEQEREVRKLQEKHPEIRIFWGIESDILADGSLDYEPKVLKRFDFVVASVHSRFQMDRETMTLRILEAIRNPCTRFVGHVTGRLLLGRAGYEVDMERIIAEASRHDVAIEINANPARLDIDWRWGAELRRKNTWVSINPDAHETDGLQDTWFGIAMARKALLPPAQIVNSLPVEKVEKWLQRK